jgi:hypothetical protein
LNNETKKEESASVMQVAGAIFSAFTGIRKKSAHEHDAKTIKLHQVVIGGLIGGAVFVLSVLLLVRLVTS